MIEAVFLPAKYRPLYRGGDGLGNRVDRRDDRWPKFLRGRPVDSKLTVIAGPGFSNHIPGSTACFVLIRTYLQIAG